MTLRDYDVRPRTLACIGLLAASLFIVAFVLRRGLAASSLIVAGDQFSDQRLMPPGVTVSPHSAGYDGQFYYRMALAPLSSAPRESGVRFDYPVYRQQRIVYPVLARILSGANPALVPYSLLGTNLIALFCVAALAATLAKERGAPAITALAIIFYPGWVLVLLRDCVELTEGAFLLFGIWCLVRRRHVLGTVALTLAVLAKETALLFCFAVGLAALTLLVRRRWLQGLTLLVVATVPALVHFGYTALLFHRWGLPPSLGTEAFVAPFTGVWSVLRSDASNFDRFTFLYFVEILALIVVGWTAASQLRKDTVVDVILAIAFVCQCALLVSLQAGVWQEDWAFLRASSEYWILSSVVLFRARGRMVLVSGTLLWWLLLVGHIWRWR
jgi:hypothetical protein